MYPVSYTHLTKAAAFQLGPGVRVRLSVKEHLQAVVLPVHCHTTPIELPAGKFLLCLFGKPFSYTHLDVYKRQCLDSKKALRYHRAFGSMIVNVVPAPGMLAAVIVPLWTLTNSFAIESPNPFPLAAREWSH